MRLVVKYGGSAAGSNSEGELVAELATLRAKGHEPVLVHGGGPHIDRELALRGVTTKRIDGLRITDRETLDVAEAVLCASLNKRLVRACLRAGIPAIGISGQDGGMIRVRPARASGVALGFVGEIARIDPVPLVVLLDAGFTPVVAPLAIDESSQSAYNVNADTAAGALAAALGADAYVALTDVARVLADPRDRDSGVEQFTSAGAVAFAKSPACTGGMRPKVLAAAEAVAGGVKRSYICAARKGAISAAIAGDATVIADS